VAKMLRGQALDADAVFKQALALYQTPSSDMAQTARLFQQAADQGHASAQYYLGMIYERGVGVPRDLAAALNWYRQSATNGFAEAITFGVGNFFPAFLHFFSAGKGLTVKIKILIDKSCIQIRCCTVDQLPT